MANDLHVKILKQGVESWNKWRVENPDITPDLKEAPLTKADLRGTNLKAALLNGADLSDSVLNEANLSGADLRGAILKNTKLKKASLGDANFEGATLEMAILTGSYLSRANFYKATLTKADMSEADLSEADFSRARLTDAKFHSSKFVHADFTRANDLPADFPDQSILKADDSQKKIIAEGVESWDKYLISNKDKNLVLHHIDFSGKNLRGIRLRKAVLWGSNFSNADLSNADLSEADLYKANLRGANLSEAILSRADLRKADLSGANLGKADLSGADLGNADLSHANMQKTSLLSANLKGAVLDSANFTGTAIFVANLDKDINWDTAKFSCDPEHLEKLREGPEKWNQWRKEAGNRGIIPVLRGANLRDANLEGADLSNAELWRADLQEAKLNGAKLTNAILREVDLRWTDFRKNFSLNNESLENLQRDKLPEEVIKKLEAIKNQNFLTQKAFEERLENYKIDRAMIKLLKLVRKKTDLSGANLLNADLRNAYFDRSTKITKSNFKGAALSDEVKDVFDWGDADFGARDEHVQKLQEGVVSWNNWRKDYPNIIPVLRGARLKNQDYSGADLSHADLWNANLYGINLDGANLQNAYLRNTDLREATLRGAYLNGANLWATDLSKTDLRPGYKQNQQLMEQQNQEAQPDGKAISTTKKAKYHVSELEPGTNGKIRTNLANARLNDAIVANARFDFVILSGATLCKADMQGTNFKGADLNGTDLSEVNFNGACLINADLKETNLPEANLGNADLSGADLGGLDMNSLDVSSLEKMDRLFSKADLTGVILPNKSISDAILARAKYNPDHLAKLNEGPAAWNAWRKENPQTIPVLRKVVLSGKSSFNNWFRITDSLIEKGKSSLDPTEIQQLEKIKNRDFISKESILHAMELPDGESASTIGMFLENARQDFNLRDFNLSRADLRGAIFEGVDLTGANLRYADLERANLRNTKLNKTRLREANLTKAWMEGAELFGARVIQATLTGTDLSNINNAELPAEFTEVHADAEPKKRWLVKKWWLDKKITTTGHRTIFTHSDLSGAKLIGAELKEADFNKANLTQTDASFANFTNATFNNAVLRDTNLSNAVLDGASFGSVDLSSAKFSYIQQQVDRLSKGPKKWNTWRKNNPELKPILRDADLANKDLRKFNLSDADLREANLGAADLRDADLQGADLGGATLRKALLRRSDLRGVNFKAANLREADLSEAKISGADLTKADLNSADLSYADLQSSVTDTNNTGKTDEQTLKGERKTLLVGADLRESDLYGANLDRADLDGANLTQANLSRVSLREAILNNSDLRRANLSGANLKAAHLENANLSGANLIGAQYSDEDLKKNDPERDYSKYDWIRNLMDEIKEGYIIIRNRTARRIQIKENLIVLPPFGERRISLNEYQKSNSSINKWKASSLITLDVNTLDPDQQIRFNRSSKYAAKSIIGKIWNFLLWLTAYLSVKIRKFFQWFPHYFSIHFMRFMSFIPVLLVGIGMPAATIYFFGGGQKLLFSGQAISLEVLARSLQFLLIAIASLLPVLLYYLFDRQQLGTLRENFYRNVLELDSKIMTLDDAKSIYGVRVAEVYGPEDLPGGKQPALQQVTRLPILVATLVITLGWIITLMPVGEISSDFGVAELYKFLTPDLNPINFGFLGAYFFSINMIIRRYTRADLKPKTYSHITVRFLVVTILVWVISLLPRFGDGAPDDPRSTLMILAFFIGIVPETALTIIKEFLQRAFGKAIPSLNEKMPLTSLDGITIYERARLEEEGIENIENLVYYDLIDLMLQTRIPLSRLIDWVDQGILHLHLWNELKDAGDKEEKSESYLVRLRSFGIRNASDLIEVYQRIEERDKQAGMNSSDSSLIKLLNILGPSEKNTPPPLEIIYDALQNDEWLGNIIRWRSRNSRPGERAYTLEEMYVSFDELKNKNVSGDKIFSMAEKTEQL